MVTKKKKYVVYTHLKNKEFFICEEKDEPDMLRKWFNDSDKNIKNYSREVLKATMLQIMEDKLYYN